MIISDPARDASKVLIVNFSTWQPHLYLACVIEAGEHPFVVHRTVVNFARARIVTDAALERLQAAGRLQTLSDALAPALLKRIRESAMNSVTLPLEAGDILIDQELVE